MSINFNAHLKNGKVLPFKCAACFAPLTRWKSQVNFQFDVKKKDSEVEKFHYLLRIHPGLKDGVVRTFIEYLCEHPIWSAPLEYTDVDRIIEEGVVVNADKYSSSHIVATMVAFRLLDEYTDIPRFFHELQTNSRTKEIEGYPTHKVADLNFAIANSFYTENGVTLEKIYEPTLYPLFVGYGGNHAWSAPAASGDISDEPATRR